MPDNNHSKFPPEILQGRYEIQQQIGKKAGRRTVIARDLNTQKLVIIKLLTFSSDFAWEDLKLFEREAETVKALDYPAIPRYLDYFELDSGKNKGYALVQSYLEGKSLEEYMQTGRKFTEKEVKRIAQSLLGILIYLHGRQPPVIHRDIKPSNIILLEHRPYLVDFGSVQTLASKGGKTITVVGTYGYMPPEQFGGYASPASDLYSLGATLITLATGIHPADLPQKDMGIAFEEYVDLSPAFIAWLQKMTEPSLERRFSTAEVALEVLVTGKDKTRDRIAIYQDKPLTTIDVFWSAIWRSTGIGGGVAIIAAALYSTVVIPVLGTIVGGLIAALLVLPIALGNGFLVGIISRIFFFPLKHPLFHRRTITVVSIIVSTVAAVISFASISSEIGGHYINFHMRILLIFAPSIITGLSMGVASKSHAQWYEQQIRLRGK
ncbi:MAG: serine/threonine-protein kinase [Nostocaceae cyanobacterium]|nr:serine/threonine-protein kinase [Nostocaceae cyanobacterium]